ncbi:MAG: aminopeptidase P family protein [Myxococcota bacterium]
MDFARRRQRLTGLVDGPILLLGNGTQPRNLPMNRLPFRQDSTFLYFTGCAEPDAAAILDGDGFELFLTPTDDEDALWHGPQPGIEARGAALGADRTSPVSALLERVSPGVRTLAVPDPVRNAKFAERIGQPLWFGVHHGHDDLVDAVIQLRRSKDADEIAELRKAAEVTREALEATMAATRPGSHERDLWTLFEAVLRLRGCNPGYETILTQSGEVLHHHGHADALEAGRMVLLDGGGERTDSGYTVDITRTWPVSGTFSPRQRAAYEAVLAAQEASIALCRPGVPYREVHDASCRLLARFLVDEGLVSGDVDGVVERGAHALFFPHGVGHHLGLDVHDLENFGDRPSYPEGVGRPEGFGTRNLRLDLPLEPGWVVTIEPGFYVVPAILANAALREQFAGVVDFAAAEAWTGFGGIRIEDDVHVTNGGPEVLTSVPKAVSEVEALVGSGPSVVERRCGP